MITRWQSTMLLLFILAFQSVFTERPAAFSQADLSLAVGEKATLAKMQDSPHRLWKQADNGGGHPANNRSTSDQLPSRVHTSLAQLHMGAPPEWARSGMRVKYKSGWQTQDGGEGFLVYDSLAEEWMFQPDELGKDYGDGNKCPDESYSFSQAPKRAPACFKIKDDQWPQWCDIHLVPAKTPQQPAKYPDNSPANFPDNSEQFAHFNQALKKVSDRYTIQSAPDIGKLGAAVQTDNTQQLDEFMGNTETFARSVAEAYPTLKHQAACHSSACGPNHVVKINYESLKCLARACDTSEARRDQEECCVEQASCTTMANSDCGRDSDYVLKENQAKDSFMCARETCTKEADIDKCCDAKEICTAFTECGTDHVLRETHADLKCAGKRCEDADKSQCCVAKAACDLTLACGDGYQLKTRLVELNVKCAAAECSIAADRDNCCDSKVDKHASINRFNPQDAYDHYGVKRTVEAIDSDVDREAFKEEAAWQESIKDQRIEAAFHKFEAKKVNGEGEEIGKGFICVDTLKEPGTKIDGDIITEEQIKGLAKASQKKEGKDVVTLEQFKLMFEPAVTEDEAESTVTESTGTDSGATAYREYMAEQARRKQALEQAALSRSQEMPLAIEPRHRTG